MINARLLLGIWLIISFLPGCYTKCKGKVDEQARVIEQQQKLISELETKQKKLEAKVNENKTLMRELRDKISTLRDNKKILLQQIEDKTSITVPNAVLFSSGYSSLSSRGEETISTLCEVLKNYPDRTFCVEGHTDTVPIAGKLEDKYPTNWELSTARALEVMHHMVSRCRISPNQVSVKGYGPFQPIASNDSPEGRAKNRRVVIVIGSPGN